GSPAQVHVLAFLQLVQEHNLAPDDIEAVEIHSSHGSNLLTGYPHPCFHFATMAALAAVYREVRFEHIHDPRHQEDPRVRAFLHGGQVSVVRPGREAVLDPTPTTRPRSGAELRRELHSPPMTPAELQQKFRNLAGLRLDSGQVADLERQLEV